MLQVQCWVFGIKWVGLHIGGVGWHTGGIPVAQFRRLHSIGVMMGLHK